MPEARFSISDEDLAILFEEVMQQPFYKELKPGEFEAVVHSLLRIFDDWEFRIVPGFSGLVLPNLGTSNMIGTAMFSIELFPALMYAHRFFGNTLPSDLVTKLRNPTQINDTAFELLCLGFFATHHECQYEPTLSNGKVPDLLVKLDDDCQVYIECKSEGRFLSGHHASFSNANDAIFRVLDMDSCDFVKSVWELGLRIEVKLSRCPSDADVQALADGIKELTPHREFQPTTFGLSITLSLVSRIDGFDPAGDVPSMVMQVTETPRKVEASEAYACVYPWNGLIREQTRSQKKLLKTARIQLREIPAGSFGCICLQITNSRRTVPKLREVLGQKEFSKIPFLLINPIGNGTLISRNDVPAGLKERLFGLYKR